MQYGKCVKCGKRVSKHEFYFNGCRVHVENYSTLGIGCSESNCEYEHRLQCNGVIQWDDVKILNPCQKCGSYNIHAELGRVMCNDCLEVRKLD